MTHVMFVFFFFQAEDGIRDIGVTGVQTVLFRSRLPVSVYGTVSLAYTGLFLATSYS